MFVLSVLCCVVFSNDNQCYSVLHNVVLVLLVTTNTRLYYTSVVRHVCGCYCAGFIIRVLCMCIVCLVIQALIYCVCRLVPY